MIMSERQLAVAIRLVWVWVGVCVCVCGRARLVGALMGRSVYCLAHPSAHREPIHSEFVAFFFPPLNEPASGLEVDLACHFLQEGIHAVQLGCQVLFWGGNKIGTSTVISKS